MRPVLSRGDLTGLARPVLSYEKKPSTRADNDGVHPWQHDLRAHLHVIERLAAKSSSCLRTTACQTKASVDNSPRTEQRVRTLRALLRDHVPPGLPPNPNKHKRAASHDLTGEPHDLTDYTRHPSTLRWSIV